MSKAYPSDKLKPGYMRCPDCSGQGSYGGGACSTCGGPGTIFVGTDAPAEPVGGTPVEREIERAKLHGPDLRTLEMLASTLARAKAAEQDFIQVHKNCMEARDHAEKAEREVAGLRADAERLKQIYKALEVETFEEAMNEIETSY